MRKIMNTRSILLIAFMIGALLAGCTAHEPDAPVEPPVEVVEEPVEAPAEPEEYKELCSIDGNERLLMQQLAFINEGNTITLGDIADEEKMSNLFGKAGEFKSHTFAEGDGRNLDQLLGLTEKVYDYDGLVVKTIEGEEIEPFIFSIEITDPKYMTLRKIKVGDSYDVLRESYPEGVLLGGELTDGADDYRYEPFDYVNVMNFHINNRVVESISITRLLD
ncbi:MAG TPA: hypothetical protein PKD08_07905 [Gudongella oleilytica]|nr:hypothetical protein [Gudongella oleilytica]